MVVKLLLLILASAFLTVICTAQDNHRPKQKDLSWGVKAGVFQMAGWTNPAADTVFVAVRNASRKKVCYCKSDCGGYLSKIYARKTAASDWQEIRFKPLSPEEIEKYRCVEVSMCFNTTLKPNEEIPFPSRLQNTSPNKNYLLSIDLRRLIFPSDWSGALEVKIAATFVNCRKEKGGVVKVESPVVKINLPFAEATRGLKSHRFRTTKL